jgi:pimeloyl-ACP methyl ester carboxylesterase
MVYREETASVRGRKARLLRGGSGGPLLFLPDTFSSSWLPIHESLAARYEVFLPMHPGCAVSDDGFEGVADIEDLVFHYLDPCEALGLESPALIGASLGGWVAVEWAVRNGNNLKSVILVDALGLRLPQAPAADILSIDADGARQLLFADANSALALELISDSPKPDEMIAVIQASQTLARFAWQFPDNPKLRHYLYRVRAPTLVVWGEGDGFVSVDHGKAYHQGIGHSEFVILPHSAHLPHIEQPQACGAIMLDFLKRQAN